MVKNFKEQSNVDFGFQKVAASRKAAMVGGIFSAVAGKYDLMNDLMSLGLHRLWKDKMVALVSPSEGAKIIDVAGGTGDIAFRLYRKLKKQGRGFAITVSDINAEMLEEGRKKSINENILDNIDWQVADGENMPFADNNFDHYMIAFGIRNFTNIEKGLEEAYRILKPGGQFICMEFGPLPGGLAGKIYDLYSFHAIPAIGKMVAGNADAYRYLVESIRKFPPPAKFAGMIEAAGFRQVKVRPLNHGVVNIHSGWKI